MRDGVLHDQRGTHQGAAAQPVLAPPADGRRLLHGRLDRLFQDGARVRRRYRLLLPRTSAA